MRNESGLSRALWNQGCVFGYKKNFKKQIELWEKSLQIIGATFYGPDHYDEVALRKIKAKLMAIDEKHQKESY